MSWLAVARLELRVARRSRGLLAVVAVSAALGAAAVWLPTVALGDGLTPARAAAFLVAPLKLGIGLTALLAGYGAVAGPRSGGQLKLALGLPNARADLVIGAFVGRGAVVLAGVVVALAAAAAACLTTFGSVPVGPLAGLGGLLCLFAVAMTALAVGLSAASPTRGTAAVAAVAAFVVFEFLWGVVPQAAHYLVAGSLPGAVVPPWVVLLERLQPFAAFETAAELVVPVTDEGVRLSTAGAAADDPGTGGLEARVDGPVPGYLDPAVGLWTLIGWAVLALGLGLLRFVRADL